jgi:hypothetical protein
MMPNNLTSVLATNFLPNQNYGKPKLRHAKIKTAKIKAKKHRRVFGWLPKSRLANFLFYMQFKNFLETCQNFGHKHWYVNSLVMNQLMTINFSMS